MSYKISKNFTTTKKRRIKYFFLNNKSQINVVFFHGFMSDMLGAKPSALQKYCKKKKINFLKFEYSGHGKSSGNFVDGNISKWTDDAKQLIKHINKKNKQLIFIGSSMGSWIALNLFSFFKKKIVGFIGIASAPNFLEELMWKKFDKKTKETLKKEKIFYLKHGEFTYPLTLQLIKDGKRNKISSKKIVTNIPVVLFHGLKDDVVPKKYSKEIYKKFKTMNKKLIKIKNGDHSLSRKSDLNKICKELNNIISNHL